MMVHRKMLALTEGARARIALTVALGLAISGTYVAQGVVVARIVSRILDGEPWTGALALVGVVALLAAFRAALLRLREMSSMLTAAAVKVALRQRLYRALLVLGPATWNVRGRGGAGGIGLTGSDSCGKSSLVSCRRGVIGRI